MDAASEEDFVQMTSVGSTCPVGLILLGFFWEHEGLISVAHVPTGNRTWLESLRFSPPPRWEANLGKPKEAKGSQLVLWEAKRKTGRPAYLGDSNFEPLEPRQVPSFARAQSDEPEPLEARLLAARAAASGERTGPFGGSFLFTRSAPFALNLLSWLLLGNILEFLLIVV